MNEARATDGPRVSKDKDGQGWARVATDGYGWLRMATYVRRAYVERISMSINKRSVSKSRMDKDEQE